MSKSPRRYRSFEKIETADLARLSKLAMDDLKGYFERKPDSRYANRLKLLCLCQGAAQHYVYRDRGVNDFDIWAFFRSHASGPFPTRGRRGRVDFGPSRFGRTREPGYTGRRVDVLGMSAPICKGETEIASVRKLLGRAVRRTSAWHLAQNPVVVIWPRSIRGRVIWEVPSGRRRTLYSPRARRQL